MQLHTLTGLVELDLYEGVVDNQHQLSHLGQLRTLSIWKALSASLPRLTPVQSLRVDCDRWFWEDYAPILCSALKQLTGLRELDLLSVSPQPLQHISGLAHLQRLMWWERASSAALPAGLWLAAVREVHVLATVAVASLGVLSAAPQLHTLHLNNCEDVGPHWEPAEQPGGGPAEQPHQAAEQLHDVLRWAEQRPSLLKLGMHFYSKPCRSIPADLAAAAEQVHVRKPSLCIDFTGGM